jgi:hypothetical protein
MISFNLITSFNVKVFLYSNYFDTRNSSEFFPSRCLTNCIPERPRRVFVASCTLHFVAQPVLFAVFAPMCMYLSSDTGEVRSNAPVSLDMRSAAVGTVMAYRTGFTVKTPGSDNICTMASNRKVRTKLFTVFRIQYSLQHVSTKPGHLREIHKT